MCVGEVVAALLAITELVRVSLDTGIDQPVALRILGHLAQRPEVSATHIHSARAPRADSAERTIMCSLGRKVARGLYSNAPFEL